MRGPDHGFPEDIWNAAKAEAREAMMEVAGREDLISYSDLANRINSCRFEPRDRCFHQLLGEISTAEDAAGRGMLSVVVVHKDGDGRPGPGFFNLAQELGRDISDQVRFWIEELKKAHDEWSRHPRSG